MVVALRSSSMGSVSPISDVHMPRTLPLMVMKLQFFNLKFFDGINQFQIKKSSLALQPS
jgi:hypothetical protein